MIMTSMYSFIWKGLDSWKDFGIIINTLPPWSIPEKNVDEIEIQGRDGNLTIDYGTYKSLTIPLACTLWDDANIDEVKAWLTGYSDLSFNWAPTKVYHGKLINRIDIAQSLDNLGEFPLIFSTQPFAYATDNLKATLGTSGTIINPGSTISLPLITIYGTGALTLVINDNLVNFKDIVTSITIDSDLMDAYCGNQNMNNNMSGEFPELSIGTNTINSSGVTKIEITPNFRYL